MAATTAAIVGAAAAVGGTAIAAKGLSNAEKAAQAAANAKPPQVNIAETDAQARRIALQNAIDSAALEERFNPGAAELRRGSLEAVMAALNAPTDERDAFISRIASQAGVPLSVGPAQQYESALTKQAVEAAARDLALGGELPQDVRNLVARRALAQSGTVTGGLNLGRDLTTRDLGLTSLDLYQRRLDNAASLGQAEAAIAAGNAGLRQQNDVMQLDAQRYGRDNLLQSGSLLDQIMSGDFSRALAAAQLGQNIAQPASGLDPGSVANLAIGNTNAQAAQQQQAMGLRAGAANAQTAFGSQLAGTGIGIASQFMKPATPAVQPYKPFSSPYAPNSASALIASKNIFGP